MSQSPNLGELVDELHKLRERKRAIESQFKPKVEEISAEMAAAQERLIALMEAAGTMAARGTRASFTLTESLTPNVKNWEIFSNWVQETGNFQVLVKRVSAPALLSVRETIKGKRIKGVEFIKSTSSTLANLKKK